MKTVSRAVKITCLLATGWCLSGWAVPAATAQVMDQVPSDSLVVLKINHLADTNTKIAAMLQTLGVTDLVPTLKDPLQTVEDQLGVSAGLDTKRDAAIVVPNVPMGEGSKPPIVILLPVSDYKAFLGSTTLVRTEGDVSVVHFKDKEDDAFVENWGAYAAISPKQEFITGKHDGIKSTGLTAKQLDEKDVCIFINFPTLKPLLQTKLKENWDQVMTEIAKGTDPAKVKVKQAALQMSINVVTEFLNDAQTGTVGISVTDGGIASSTIIELPADSYLGKMTAQIKETDQPLMAGLPKENYLFFGGSVMDGKAFAQVFDDVLAPVVKELPGVGDDGKKLLDSIAAFRTALPAYEGGAFGLVAPTAAIGQGPMLRMLAIYKSDASAMKAAYMKQVDIINSMGKIFNDDPSDVLKQTVTADFKNISGVKFDRVQAEVNPDDTSQNAMHLSEGLTQMFGPDGASALMGEADGKTLVIALGIEDDLLGQAVDAAKANKDVLTEDLTDVDAGLPKKRAVAAYLGLGQIMSTALSYAKANGMAMPVQLPNNLPPIGITYGNDGPDMRIDSFVPINLVKGLVQAGLNIYMQMNGHGGGGGGGL